MTTSMPNLLSCCASSSVNVQTPPTVSVVISTRRIDRSGIPFTGKLQLYERGWPLRLNITEGLEVPQVKLMCTLPGSIIGRTPQTRVIRGARIREQRHGFI